MKYNPKTWIPTNEWGELTKKSFDKRFPIDRTYRVDSWMFNYYIRFVKHPDLKDDKIRVFKVRKLKWYWLYKFGEKYIKIGNIFSFNKLVFKTSEEIDDTLNIEKKYNITLYERWQVRQKKINLIIDETD